MEDIFLPGGSTKASRPDAGGGNIRNVPVFGIVKDNVDPTRSGRVSVYISDFGGDDPDNSDNWTVVSPATPFYGCIEPTAGETGYGNYKSNPSSYGMWNSPPDIGTNVICIFINGDMNYGYYIGCAYKPEALQMVPAIGATTNVVPNAGEAQSFGGAEQLPVTNLNTNNAAISDGSNFLNEPKPVHSYTAAIMHQQGILRDPIRGPITTSANRESPSRVGWGVSTPGRPIYEGGFDDVSIAQAAQGSEKETGLKVISRRGGHSIVMDDGDQIGNDQVVRIRTALGHQILLSDNGQTIFILHSNGQSYIELGKEGTIDMYSTNSVNIRTQGDLNLHADNNININAKKDLNIQAENINVNADKAFSQKTGTDYKAYTMGTHTLKVDGPMSMASKGEGSYASDATMYINGKKINLNTGKTSVTPDIIKAIPLIAHTDTLFDAVKGFAAAPGKLMSITSRAPAHAPWANAGQGVDVKVDLGASSALPAAPNPTITAVNESAQNASAPGVSLPNAATIPPVPAVSEAIDKNVTGTMLGAVAQNASLGPAGALVSQGGGIVQTASGNVATVGQLAQTPKQLESAGILKPGSSTLIDGMVQRGANLNSAMSSNMFTGKPGGESLQNLVANPTAQLNAAVTNLRQSQTSLTSAGIMTGKEAPGAISGLVMAGATAGVNNVLGAVRNVNPGALNTNLPSGVTGAVASAIKTGNFAAGAATNYSGGLGSISSSLGALASTGGGGFLNSQKGVTASAFSAITNSFKPLQANVPQNLKAITQATTQTRAIRDLTIPGQAPAIPNLNNLNSITSTASKSIASAASGLASGVNVLPGGQGAIASVLNNAPGISNILPGTQGLNSIIQTASTGAMNKLSPSSLLPSGSGFGNLGATLQSGITGLSGLSGSGIPAGLATQLSSALSALASNGSQSIKLPTVALNTVNRAEITAGVSNVIGDPKIPKPNLTGEIPSSARSGLEQQLAKQRELTDAAKKLKQFAEESQIAQQKYLEAKATLPQGDPEIERLRQEWNATFDNPERIRLKQLIANA